MSGLIHHPLVTEKAMNDMDFENSLQFIVDAGATKDDVRDAVEGLLAGLTGLEFTPQSPPPPP